MTTFIPTPRPHSLFKLIEQATYEVCKKIKPSETEARLLSEAVTDHYDHIFCTNGHDLNDNLVPYGWKLTAKEIAQLNDIYPLVEKLSFERQIKWYNLNKEGLPTFNVGDKLKEGVILEVIEAEDTLVAVYYVERFPSEDGQVRYTYVPFEGAKAFEK